MIHSYAQREIFKPGSPVSDWCKKPETLKSFWPFPGNTAGIEAAIGARGPVDLQRRKQVANAIRRQYAAVGINPPRSLNEFEKGFEVISVGHQLQAGGGPAFFHYKILSALRWAAQLRASGTPAIAVYWMASEDHDFAEISTTYAPGGVTFEWTPEYLEQSPVGRITWDARAERDWKRWCSAVLRRNSDFQAQSMPLAHRVRHWIEEWFGHNQLVVVDGDDPDLKSLATSVLTPEWSGNGISTALSMSAADYADKWISVPLQVQDNNLFVLEESGLRMRADRWLDEYGEDKVEGLRPNQLSPNAALRPLYQEFLLQSAAFVGGPSEVGYWLMLGRAFQHHRVAQPALLVRDGAFVHQESTKWAAAACDWTPKLPALTGDMAVAAWADKQLMGNGELDRAFEEWSKALIAHAKGVPGDAVPTTRAALTKMEKEMVMVRKKWRKILRHQCAKEVQIIREAFDGWICPDGKMQERRLSALPLMEAEGGGVAFAQKWFETVNGADEPQFLVFC